jgi:tetratricopeptide (TPR) repeat protein
MTINRNVRRAGQLTLAFALAAMAWAAPTRVDEPAKELTFEERDKVAKDAVELHDKAGQLSENGKYAAATELESKSLSLWLKLYPGDKYPVGHPNLASSLLSMGALLVRRGEYGRAEPFFRDALKMYKKLYPPTSSPTATPNWP